MLLSHTSENVFQVGLMLVFPYGFNDYVIHIYLQHVLFRRLCSSLLIHMTCVFQAKRKDIIHIVCAISHESFHVSVDLVH